MKRARWLGIPIGGLIGAAFSVRPLQIRNPESSTAYLVVGAITGLLAAFLLLNFLPNIEQKLPAPRSPKGVRPLQWVFVVLNVVVVAGLIAKYLRVGGSTLYVDYKFPAFLMLYPFFSAGVAMLTCPDSTFSVVTGRVLLILFAILLAIVLTGIILFFGLDAGGLVGVAAALLGLGSGWWLTSMVADSQRRRSGPRSGQQ